MVSLGRAIFRKPAKSCWSLRHWWGQRGRGWLKSGMIADIAVFDSARIQDHATYTDPNHYSTGIVDLSVNGTPVLENLTLTGEKPDRFIQPPSMPLI